MKSFLFKLALFCVCVAMMDVGCGFLFTFLHTHAKGGSTQNNFYISEQCRDEIVILGSSRASHHYIPSIIEDSLGLSCYNCGEEGNGAILAAARLMMLTERYSPKLVIYEVTPGYDYMEDADYSKYFRYLKPYYYKKGPKAMIDKFSEPESRLKMLSQMYRNNSRIIPDVMDNIVSRDNIKGYAPLFGDMVKINAKNDNVESRKVDPLKQSVVEYIITLCKNKQIPLVFMVSPRYNGTLTADYSLAIQLAGKYNIPFVNHVDMEGVSDNMSMFQDVGHMNDKGAHAYTQRIISEIRDYINQ